MKRRYLFKAAIFLAVIGGLYGFIETLHQWEPTRIIWKRWKAKTPYRYEEIDPQYLKTNPADLITIHSPADALKARRALIGSIWGDEELPFGKQPERIDRDIPLGKDSEVKTLGGMFYATMANLAGIDRVHHAVDKEYSSKIFHFRPRRGNNRLVIYHNGYGGTGTFHDRKELIAELVSEGYAVMALNLPSLGENSLHRRYLPRFGWYQLNNRRLLDLVERPMRFWIEPAVGAVNYAKEAYAYDSIDMLGFSSGGWVTMVVSAADARIRRSYPVAATYPMYMRSGDRPSPRSQYYGPMVRAANYLEMFALATFGSKRRQLQIFNRFDRCCYSGVKGKHYEKAVQDTVKAIGDGGFQVMLDETHARHTVSGFAMKAILADMAGP